MVKALIVIDMINAYRKDIEGDRKIVLNQLKLIKAFKDKKLPVIVAIPGRKRKGKNPVMTALWGDELKGDNKRKKGSKLRDLIHKLQKIKWDKIIKKPEYSVFFETDLDQYTKSKKITDLYLTGIYSGVCVHYSGVDAAQRGIWPILVTDASTTFRKSLHRKNCKKFVEVAGKIKTTKEVLGEV